MRLRYNSQGQAPADRLQRRADELYARAGVESEDGKYILKHKWMRWGTFNRLMDRANQISGEADIAALAGLERLGFFSWDDANATVLGDPGSKTKDAASGGDPSLALVGTLDRAEDASGQG